MGAIPFVPISIIIPLVIVLIVLFILQRYLQVVGLRKVFAIYFIILVLAAIFVHLLPKDSFISLEDIKMKGNNTVDYNTFNDAINTGNLNDHEQFSIKKEWDLSISANELEILYPESSSPVFVERKEMNDNSIEVIHYTSKFSFGSTDLTEEKNSFTITFHDNKLMITNPERFTYEISGFKKDFVVAQFTGGSLFTGDYFVPINSRSFDAIVIRVPKGLKLSPNSQLHLIMKD